MSLLFHPKTLQLLLKFKKAYSKDILITLLPLILDYTSFLDISKLLNILSSNKFTINELELRKYILLNFRKKIIKNQCLCIAINIEKSKYRKLIEKNRKDIDSKNNKEEEIRNNFIEQLYNLDSDNSVVPDLDEITSNKSDILSNNNEIISSNIIVSNNTNKTKIVSNNINSQSNNINIQNKNRIVPLNFAVIKNNPISIPQIDKFIPLPLKNATFIYNPKNIILSTQRKRDDLINPVKLQFIKLFDQNKLPIYQKRGIIKRWVLSYTKIPGILTYDQESSEEYYDSNEDEAISEELTSSEDSLISKEEEEWIEKDSESVEITKYCKKPVLIYENDIKIEVFIDKDLYIHESLF